MPKPILRPWTRRDFADTATAQEALANSVLTGVCADINTGLVPSTYQINLVSASSVRFQCSWHIIETSEGVYTPTQDVIDLIALGRPLIAVVSDGNDLYTADNQTMPQTAPQIAAFCAFIRWIVTYIKPIAIELGNELNGSFDWGIPDVPGEDANARKAAYVTLCNSVLSDLNTAYFNPSLPAYCPKLILGATTGQNISGWFSDLGDINWASLTPSVYLGIHPYFANTTQTGNFATNMATIRNTQGLTNPAWYTEWGGPSAQNFIDAHPGESYVNFFKTNVLTYVLNTSGDPIPPAGGNFWLIKSNGNFPTQGLIHRTDDGLSIIGHDYVNNAH